MAIKGSLKTRVGFQAAFGVREASVGIFTALQTNRHQNNQQRQPADNGLIARGFGRGLLYPAEFAPEPENQRKVHSISSARASIIRNNRSAMSVSFFQAAVARCRGSLKSLRGGFKLVVRRLVAYRLPAGLIFVLDFQAASAVCGRQPETEMEWRVG